ncbi:MAG: YfhO family protein [Acidimicrobiales bacterium]
MTRKARHAAGTGVKSNSRRRPAPTPVIARPGRYDAPKRAGDRGKARSDMSQVRYQHPTSTASIGDIAAIITIAAITAIAFYPALARGTVLGSLDIMRIWPVTHGLFSHVHNKASFDQASQMVPWLTLDWQSIHTGAFPLWNRYTLLGLAQFGNFQSGVLSLPHLISYIFPLRNAYLVSVSVTMLIAGTGAYLAARVLGAGPAIATVGAVGFELSGSIANWAGWPQGEVNAWLGWILALVVLLHRSERPLRLMAALSVVVAFVIYAGHPESYLFLALTTGITGLVVTAMQLRSHSTSLFKISRTALRVGVSVLLGCLLAAPLLLVGGQLIGDSTRATLGFTLPYKGLPLSAIPDLLVPQYFGAPTASSHWFGPFYSFYELSSYVGPIIVFFAIYAILRLWRRPLVIGMTVAAATDFFLVFDFGPMQKLISLIPQARIIGFTRLLMSFDFLLVMLAVLGMTRAAKFLGNVASNVAKSSNTAARLAETRADGIALAASALAVGALMYVLSALNSNPPGLTRAEVSIRLTSISRATEGYWAIILMMAAWLIANRAIRWNRKSENRRKRLIVITTGIFAAVVLAAQAILLIPPVVEAATYGHSFYPQDSITRLVKNTVKGSLLGVGPPLAYLTAGASTGATATDRALPRGGDSAPGAGGVPKSLPATPAANIAENVSGMPASTGYLPESNIAYMVSLFAARDPMLPKIYLTSWADTLGVPMSSLLPKKVTGPDNVFAPTMLTPNLARLYGVRYLFVSTYTPGALRLMARPLRPGLQLAARGKGFELVRVTGAHRFSLKGTTGTVDAIRWKGDNEVSATVTAAGSGSLIAKITALPGWHATVDGAKVRATTINKIMLGVPVARGTSTITLTYWPTAFSLGIAAALAGLAIVALMMVVDLVGLRRGRLRHGRRRHTAAT